MDKKIVVLYHGKCVDGFGAAYATWKKFGDSALYKAVSHGDDLPYDVCTDKEVYMLDYCDDSLERMQHLERVAQKLVVLDHHKSNRDIVESMKEHRYDVERSGATIAWEYFHPGVQIPLLLQHLEDGDIFRNALPDTRALFAYIEVQPFDFPLWDSLVRMLDDESTRQKLLDKAHAWNEYFNLLVDIAVDRAKLVSFMGYEVYFANSHPMMSMRSMIGNKLYTKKPPFALVVSSHPDGYGVSIRGDGSVDVSEIAKQFKSGGGHKGSAGFYVSNNEELPWKLIDKDENTSN